MDFFIDSEVRDYQEEEEEEEEDTQMEDVGAEDDDGDESSSSSDEVEDIVIDDLDLTIKLIKVVADGFTIREVVEDRDLEYVKGCGYYQVGTKQENISKNKVVYLVSKTKKGTSTNKYRIVVTTRRKLESSSGFHLARQASLRSPQ